MRVLENIKALNVCVCVCVSEKTRSEGGIVKSITCSCPLTDNLYQDFCLTCTYTGMSHLTGPQHILSLYTHTHTNGRGCWKRPVGT